MKSRHKLLSSLVLAGSILALTSGAAQATVSFQTEPVLGYSISYADEGHVTMITTSGNFVIPHDSGAGQTYFQIDPSFWNGSHWVDPTTGLFAGSGVNLDPAHTYDYETFWTFLGTPGNPTYTNTGANRSGFSEPSGFIMLSSGYDAPFFWLEDVGSWQYVETWRDNEDTTSITFTRDFTVGLGPEPATLVPEPATLALLGLGLAALGFSRRRRS